MGSALIEGWSKNQSFVTSTLDPVHPDADYQSAKDIASQFDVIVLAVKPQIMNDVITSIKHFIKSSTLILSIAAGKNISFFEDILGQNFSCVRAMPNTPALIGKGMTVLCANKNTTPSQKELATTLMQSVGAVDWIDDETLMDAVTAVSGSGPAYVFYMIEAMTSAGIDAGLPPALAEKCARQTVIGSAALVESDSKVPLATLRENVTSKGGTTETGLAILMGEKGLKNIMTQTILAAKKRGQELSK